MDRFIYPDKMDKKILEHLQKALIRDKIIVGETRARIAAVLLCLLLGTGQRSTRSLQGYTRMIREAYKLFNTEGRFRHVLIDQVANELRSKGFVDISENDAECFYIEQEGTEFVYDVKTHIENEEDPIIQRKLSDDQKDVLKVLKKAHESDPETNLINVDIMARTRMSSFEVSRVIKQLKQYDWVEITNTHSIVLTRRGLKNCKQLFPDDQTPSQSVNIHADHRAVKIEGGVSGTIGAIGDDVTVNINARVYFQELERLVQESDEITDDEKSGILSKLKDLTHHPLVIALAQKAFEMGIKGGA